MLLSLYKNSAILLVTKEHPSFDQSNMVTRNALVGNLPGIKSQHRLQPAIKVNTTSGNQKGAKRIYRENTQIFLQNFRTF